MASTKEEDSLENDEQLDLFNSDTVEKIRQAKQNNKSQFISHWEADEEDIQNWTDVKKNIFKIFDCKIE